MRQHITKGYTINPVIIKNNYNQFLEAINDIKKLVPSDSSIDNISVLELVSAFADTWLSLKQVILTVEKLSKFLVEFKKELPRKGEATDIFGAFKNHPTSFNRLNVIYC